MSFEVERQMVSFGRLGPPGEEFPVGRLDDIAFDLRPIVGDIDGDFLGGGGIEAATSWLRTRNSHAIDVSRIRIGPPITRPTAIICIGQNYSAHAEESGQAPPASPIIFLKHPNTVVGPNDSVPLPRGATAVDWEVELGVVIGRPAHYLETLEDAAVCIAGYVVSHDISERDFQLTDPAGQWSRGKCCEAFNPLGPWLYPHQDGLVFPLRLRSWVNGEQRQDSTTADMIFEPRYLVWYLSQFMRLEPGDLVNSGTPAGVGLSGRFPYLGVGDVVETEIDRLGRQRQVIR